MLLSVIAFSGWGLRLHGSLGALGEAANLVNWLQNGTCVFVLCFVLEIIPLSLGRRRTKNGSEV